MKPDMTRGALHAAVFLFAFTLALFAANLVFTAHEISSTRSAEASTIQLCQLGNDARAKQIILWERIIAISSPPPHETPAQRARRAATVRSFEAYLHKLFAPRNCRALTH